MKRRVEGKKEGKEEREKLFGANYQHVCGCYGGEMES